MRSILIIVSIIVRDREEFLLFFADRSFSLKKNIFTVAFWGFLRLVLVFASGVLEENFGVRVDALRRALRVGAVDWSSEI